MFLFFEDFDKHLIYRQTVKLNLCYNKTYFDWIIDLFK